jgi:hypothetical protein
MRFSARTLLVSGLLVGFIASGAAVRERMVFNVGWRFHLGDVAGGQKPELGDSAWRALDLPHDWSTEAAFSPTSASCTGYLPGGRTRMRRAPMPSCTRR